jgi:tRNA threonylcarbamoyladenosine biosynthesis protein TsaB
MRLLALDAATEHCSVALWMDGRVLERAVEAGKAHAEDLLDMVREVLAEGRVDLAELDGIAASIGPGAFTGVRVSVAVAQGLAFGAGLRVVAVSTLEALALRALEAPAAGAPEHAIACLDARMQEVYWGCFQADAARGLRATTAPRVSAPTQVAVPPCRHAGMGRGFAAYPQLRQVPGIELAEGAAAALPRAREFARLGALRLSLGEDLDPADLQPLYLRDKVADTEAERAARRHDVI